MRYPPAELEVWLRRYYFDAELDISCSGVESFSFGELRELCELPQSDLDAVVLRDSRSLGDTALRQAIARRFGRPDHEGVMATHGSSEAIYLVMHALLDAADHVVVVDPCYHSLRSIAASIGCRLTHVPLDLTRGCQLDIDELCRALADDARMVILNFPHNPTGASLTRHEQRRVIDACRSAGTYLIWDAAFAELVYDAPPLPDPSLEYDRAVSIGTLSKAFGLPGLRVGWCIGAPGLLDRCVHHRDFVTLHLSPLVELVATHVMTHADRLLTRRLEQARRNLDLLEAWIQRHAALVDWARPRGGVSAFLRICGYATTDALCTTLADEHGVLLVPGSCFGHPQHVRLGFGGPTAELERGLARVGDVLTRAVAPIASAAGRITRGEA